MFLLKTEASGISDVEQIGSLNDSDQRELFVVGINYSCF